MLFATSACPPDERDEAYLKCDPRDEGRGRCAAKWDSGASGVDVGGEDGEEEYDQSEGSEATSAWKKEPDRTEDFADARQGHHELGIWNRRGDHPDHVGPHAVEVRDRGEAEHDREADSRCGRPITQRSYTELACEPRQQRDHDEHDQGHHEDAM